MVPKFIPYHPRGYVSHLNAFMEEFDNQDIFFCPSLRSTPTRKAGESFLPVSHLWVDVDFQKVPEDKVSLVSRRISRLKARTVKSGSQHPYLPPNVHLYVPLRTPLGDPRALRAANKALAEWLCGDSKFADNSLLRLPGTKSYKAGSSPASYANTQRRVHPGWVLIDLVALPRFPAKLDDLHSPAPVLSVASEWTTTPLPSHAKARMARRMSTEEGLYRFGSRHKAVWAMTSDLYKVAHLTSDEIHTVMDTFSPGLDKQHEENGYNLHQDVANCLASIMAPTFNDPKHPDDVNVLATTNPPEVWDTSLTSIDKYPYHLLPKVIKERVDTCGSLPKPFIVAACWTLAANLVASSTLEIHETSRRVKPVIWTSCIGVTGTGKTPSVRTVFEEYEELESSTHSEETAAAIAEARPPNRVSRFVQDVTMERLFDILNENPYLLWNFGELARFGSTYHADPGMDKARTLHLWDARPIAVDRKKDKLSLFIRDPRVQLIGEIQPSLLAKMGDVNSGMQARWLPHLYEGGVPRRKVNAQPCPAWEEFVRERYPYMAGEGRTWVLMGEAREYLDDIGEQWNMEINTLPPNSPRRAFLCKADEHALRIALVYAEVISRPDKGGRLKLPMKAVEAAVAITNYSAGVWGAPALAWSAAEPLALNAQDRELSRRDGELDSWLVTMADGRVSLKKFLRPDIYREYRGVSGITTPQDARAVVKRYLNQNSGVLFKENTGKRGRPPLWLYADRAIPTSEQVKELNLEPLTRGQIQDVLGDF